MKSNSDASERTALLLVDLQNDFVEGGALAVPDGQAVIEIANRLIPRFDLVIATQDWHPADHQSFASQHEGIQVGDSFILGGLSQIAWPDHCIQDSHGADFVPRLNSDRIHSVIRKGTNPQIDSYSGFFDNGHRQSTGLSDYLKSQSVTHLTILGLATDYCVRATVLDAVDEGFPVTLVSDGCRGVNLEQGDVEKAIQEMMDAGAEVTESRLL